MKFVFAKEASEQNSEFVFSVKPKKRVDTLVICAADTYTVYIDGEFRAYGPERTAAGYSREKIIHLDNPSLVEIKVLANNVPNYEVDFQKAFFGAELYSLGELVYSSEDFICEIERERMTAMPRFDVQRNFIEGFILENKGRTRVETVEVPAPKILDGIGDTADYCKQKFTFINQKRFEGFVRIEIPKFYRLRTGVRDGDFDVHACIERAIAEEWREYNYVLPMSKTGFFRFDISGEGCEFFATFDDIIPEEGWVFRRMRSNDFFYTSAPSGEHTVISRVPYELRLMKIVVKGNARVIPSLILVENSEARVLPATGDERLDKVLLAARNTFVQNAVDIFTDCPGRERAGWLCDSYFTAKAERLFTGSNKIERNFLENIIIAKTPDLEAGMIPMCFPSEHSDGRYIPNYACWFVMQLRARLERTGERELIEAARDKVYASIRFFDRFVGEHGLLENLESWLFVEWTKASEYTEGVNFPINMLVSRMLEDAGYLYDDKALTDRAAAMRKAIYEMSYNGKFFVDHATRENGVLVRRDEHISEACQYYAMFSGIPADGEYKKRLVNEFGPLRPCYSYPEICKSTMFIGNMLRFEWLSLSGEHEALLRDARYYLSKMADTNLAIWEHDEFIHPTMSCNHGCGSAVAVYITDALAALSKN